jgi:hypothetical protein
MRALRREALLEDGLSRTALPREKRSLALRIEEGLSRKALLREAFVKGRASLEQPCLEKLSQRRACLEQPCPEKLS